MKKLGISVMIKSNNDTYTLIRKKPKAGTNVLFDKYAKKLYYFGIHTWKLDEDSAWELIYKTFEKVIQEINHYEFECEQKFSGFIFTVFTNFLRNHFKQKQNRENRVKLYSFDEQLFENTDNESNTQTERLVKEKLFADALELHMTEPHQESPLMVQLEINLGQMQEWERNLLLMRSQNFSYKEIEGYLNIPEKNLKVYYQRAKKKLIQIFNVYHHAE
ncbi:MAG: sigma-70 family RNA polymerase sigma factor [Bacteroidales bacterium]|jgi:RNA polymerase sigma factor (sigma-70 family)